MNKETMTVHEALTTLKTLDNRIDDAINMGMFTEVIRHSAANVKGHTRTEIEDIIRADYDSVMMLMNRRAAIRRALAASNAMTYVTVCGKQYSVSEAIEMKLNGTKLKRNLLTVMMRQKTAVENNIHRTNETTVPEAAEKYVTSLFGTKDKAMAAEIEKTKAEYITAHSLDLIDPLNLQKKIEMLREEIDDFESAVDSALSVSNALTTLNIEY